MGKLGKQKTIPWAFPMLPLVNFTLALVYINIEKCNVQFVTPTWDPTHL